MSRGLLRSVFRWIAAGLLACVMEGAAAQSFDATMLRQPTDLGMNWLLRAGDDPAYAAPGLDDSAWMVVDPSRSLKTYFPNSRPEVVWYRLHVKVAPSETGLGLAEFNLGSAFEVYVNGERLIAAGQVAPYRPSTFNARLLGRIPDAAVSSGSLLIAVRMHISPNDWVNAFPGYYPYNLAIGQEAALRNTIWLTLIGEYALTWFVRLIGLGLAIISLALFMAQRAHREYLWIFLVFVISALQTPLQIYLMRHTLPAGWVYVQGGFEIATLSFQVLAFLAFLRMAVARWIKVWLLIAAAGILHSSLQTAQGAGSATSLLVSGLPEMSLIAGAIPVLLLLHWRRGNREAGILLVPAVVYSLTIYLRLGVFLVSTVPAAAPAAMRFQSAVLTRMMGPLVVDAGSLVGCLFVLSLTLIIVLRSTRIAHQQARMEAELAAAREVQHILLPERVESVPGFVIESAYEPAREIGGDFYQILPNGNGSLLLVIGDVEGKGLPAAMLVSVLVGAIRGVAEYTSDPAELLANLNQRLVGRAGGNLATALAARIAANGTVEVANAGHLAPYLDGHEVEIAGALPLGARAGTQYEIARFELARGSRMTFFSDGVVEARNAHGELFGFERCCRLSAEPVARIVETAKGFGQHDDITAIAITRRADDEAQAWESAAPALHALPT